MTTSGSTLSVDVDVTNPGEFFACCGLLELAHRLWRGAEGWFEDDLFYIAPLDGQQRVLTSLLEPLLDCPALTEQELADKQPMSRPKPEDPEEGEDESGNKIRKPKTDPVLLGNPVNMRLNWWLRADGSVNLLKTWAANATSQQMFRKWQSPLKAVLPKIEREPERLLAFSSRIQGSYGFDSHLGWDALAVGFSLNEHTQYKRLPTRPAVELLGAVALQRFFPDLDERHQTIQYSPWYAPLAPSVARFAALGMLSSTSRYRLLTRFVYRGSFKGLDTANIVQGDSNE